jgi:ubiquinone biosynthesis protein
MDALICGPLFAADEPALFHGDPHAGNLLLVADSQSGLVKVGLLDWSLAGYLTQKVRIRIVQLIQGILLNDLGHMCQAIQILAKETPGTSALSRSSLRTIISGLIQSEDYARFALMKKAFWLLEQLSYEGVIFPPDLMLFRKAIFTLEGVLVDLYPQFNMDTFMLKYMAGLLTVEIPLRFGNLLFPLADKPENYRSLVSNADLQALVMHQYAAAVERNTHAFVELFEKQTHFMNRFFSGSYIGNS